MHLAATLLLQAALSLASLGCLDASGFVPHGTVTSSGFVPHGTVTSDMSDDRRDPRMLCSPPGALEFGDSSICSGRRVAG